MSIIHLARHARVPLCLLILVLLVCPAGHADSSAPPAGETLSIKRLFSDPALAGPTPRAVKVSPDGRRVALLRGRSTDQHQLDLWLYDVADGSLRLRVDSTQLAAHEEVSLAERERRERQRIADLHGIVDYDWAPDGHHVLFTLNGQLYLADIDAPGGAAPRQLTHGEESVIDPQLSPQGRFVSFVRAQNLWVLELATGTERQLTSDGGGAIHNAEAEFVAQEELEQEHGYWWAPDDSLIAFKRFDESAVPVARRFEIYADRTEVIDQRYPAAGDPNVTVQLGLVAPVGGAVRWAGLGADPDIYLARVDWLPNAHAVTYQRLSRDQRTLDLVLVDAATLAERTVLTERADSWIYPSNDLHFLHDSAQFVWSSERSGMRHLYLVGLDGRVRRALTQGPWQVDGLLALDESAGLVYLASNRDASMDQQLYTVHLDGHDAAHPHRISAQDGWHAAQFAHAARRVSLYVDTFSDSSTPPQVSIHAPDGRQLAWIEPNTLDATHPYAPYRAQHVVPQFGQIKARDGQPLDYMMFRPPGFDPAHHYPVMLYVYGGPTVQVVTRRWPDAFFEYMAQAGYIVFALDNRGSARRGQAFAAAIKGRLGDIEVRDQLDGVHWLQAQPWVEARHIGVFGWSYGGYMTLKLLAKGSSDLAGGAAVAPVTDWRLYDTAYTERYLGRPQSNADGYRESSVFADLDGLRSPLFLAHGMADDNVLFTNSTRLMSELQQRGVQFTLMTYPGAKHGLSTPQMRTHVFTAIRRFFDEHVAGRPAS